MCGIAGIVSSAGSVDVAALEQMRDAMTHRGPDGCGLHVAADGSVGFAHRRLAIIDLSSGGHQPMIDPITGALITFNGEIYNYRELRDELVARGHRFRTASDTEVLLASYREWDLDCLTRLNGQFAFGLHDSARRRLLLARDRAGEKPLYYRRDGSRLLFASELKGLMADPSFERRLDHEAFDLYLAYGYVPGDHCILRGVSKLPPGHAAVLALDTGDFSVQRYWTLPPTAAQDVPADQLEAELETLLEAAVRRQMVADVPLGILLSGGLDSSLVTAMAARAASDPVRTFTVTFPGHAAFDEAPHARAIAEYFGTRHTELPAEPQSADTLTLLARQFDEPIGDSAIVPTYLVSRLIRREATVALGGDGGDELFGGYPHYSWLLRQQRVRALVPQPLRAVVASAAARLPLGVSGRNHLIGFGDGAGGSISHINLYFDRRTRARLAPGVVGRAVGAERYRADLAAQPATVLRAAMETDFRSTLVDGYLVKVDRASMLTSLEIRAPFLDYTLVEFAFGRVPDRLRATRDARKILPKRLARRLLPPGFDLARKQGFTMPLGAWFAGDWGRFMEAVLRESDPRFFDHAVIEQLLAGQRRGRANTGRIFAIAMFELWRREYKVSCD